MGGMWKAQIIAPMIPGKTISKILQHWGWNSSETATETVTTHQEKFLFSQESNIRKENM